ncbi:unnamed protein product, partial [marine sediment metagenome]
RRRKEMDAVRARQGGGPRGQFRAPAKKAQGGVPMGLLLIVVALLAGGLAVFLKFVLKMF